MPFFTVDSLVTSGDAQAGKDWPSSLRNNLGEID
jgi:hypothetical protein